MCQQSFDTFCTLKRSSWPLNEYCFIVERNRGTAGWSRTVEVIRAVFLCTNVFHLVTLNTAGFDTGAKTQCQKCSIK